MIWFLAITPSIVKIIVWLWAQCQDWSYTQEDSLLKLRYDYITIIISLCFVCRTLSCRWWGGRRCRAPAGSSSSTTPTRLEGTIRNDLVEQSPEKRHFLLRKNPEIGIGAKTPNSDFLRNLKRKNEKRKDEGNKQGRKKRNKLWKYWVFT